MLKRTFFERTVLAAVLLVVTPIVAGAQELPNANRIREQLARRDRAPFLRAELAIGEATQEVAPVRKRTDPPWNGLMVGAALGALVGFSTYTDCEPVPPYRTCEGNLTTSRGMETAAAAALFGAVGLTIDVLMDRSTDVSLAPARRRGFSASISPRQVQARYRLPL